MLTREIRWAVFLPLAPVLALVVLSAEIAGLLPDFSPRPDWLWCLAFLAGIRAAPFHALIAFGWCGLVRDAILGPRMGAASFAYVLVGWITLYLMPLADLRGWPTRLVLAVSGVGLASLVKYCVDYGHFAPRLWDTLLVRAVGDCVLTAVAYVVIAMVTAFPSMRPWRERSGLY